MTTLEHLFSKSLWKYLLHSISIRVMHFLNLIFTIQTSISPKQSISLPDELFHLLAVSFLTFLTL